MCCNLTDAFIYQKEYFITADTLHGKIWEQAVYSRRRLHHTMLGHRNWWSDRNSRGMEKFKFFFFLNYTNEISICNAYKFTVNSIFWLSNAIVNTWFSANRCEKNRNTFTDSQCSNKLNHKLQQFIFIRLEQKYVQIFFIAWITFCLQGGHDNIISAMAITGDYIFTSSLSVIKVSPSLLNKFHKNYFQ